MDKIPTKDRVLDSALTLFSEKGYDGVGVDLIAENAGINVNKNISALLGYDAEEQQEEPMEEI